MVLLLRTKLPNSCRPPTGTDASTASAEQRWQLGDVAGYPTRFIKRQPLRGFSIALIGVYALLSYHHPVQPC
jgi:hypothetical protein